MAHAPEMRKNVPAMRIRTVLVLAAAFILPNAAWSDALWDKAVAITRATVDWVPGSASFLLEVVDPRGAAQESWRSRYVLTGRPDGTVTMEVISASHNTEDTTAKERQNQQSRKQGPLPRWDNPFDPRVQATLTATPQGPAQEVLGRTCVPYDFTLAKEGGVKISGTAWIDAASGVPVQVRSSQSPLPRGVFSLTTTLRFGTGPGGEGFLREAFMEGVGGLLFIRRSFRSTVSVGDYWRSAANPTGP
jgi:hypothetical protein